MQLRHLPALTALSFSLHARGEVHASPAEILPCLEISGATLRLESETGPATLTVKLTSGQPPDPWKPAWPGLTGPFISGEEGYTAPLDLNLDKLQTWMPDDLPESPEPGRFTWAHRDSANRDKFEVVTLPDPVTWPLMLEFTRLKRLPQDRLEHEIDPWKSLFITGTNVVENKDRTWDLMTAATGKKNGVWTFHHLVSAMANQAATGVSPGDFVSHWLQTFKNPPPADPPGASVAGPRPGVQPVLDPWPKISGKLDTKRSPFRLLAIVNRLDLRDSSVQAGDNRRAELRFVFCLVDQDGEDKGHAREFLVIFEFGVPLADFEAAKAYAREWTELSKPALSHAKYLEKLQTITEKVVKAGAAPGRPNGSNLNQIRTVEQYFGTASGWEFREFVIGADHHLKLHHLNMTPDWTWHDSGDRSRVMRQWIQENQEAVRHGHYQLLSRADADPGPATTMKWLRAAAGNMNEVDYFSQPIHPDCDSAVRFAFIQNTCQGCHGTPPAAGPDAPLPWDFKFRTHVSTRSPGEPAKLSSFLNVETSDEIPQRLEVLRSLAEGDPFLPFSELFHRHIGQVH